ncbi:MAG: exonuclease domain-containing protein, partial [Solobacterium sp.]|nr:exonuclease domain-containing protein [Solobacterium sp.]
MTDFPLDYTVLDIETTGLSPKNNEIIELSALKIRNKEVVGEFSVLVNPGCHISSFISNLTG